MMKMFQDLFAKISTTQFHYKTLNICVNKVKFNSISYVGFYYIFFKRHMDANMMIQNA